MRKSNGYLPALLKLSKDKHGDDIRAVRMVPSADGRIDVGVRLKLANGKTHWKRFYLRPVLRGGKPAIDVRSGEGNTRNAANAASGLYTDDGRRFIGG